MAPRKTSMAPPPHSDLLLDHAASLRAMARALLRDEHAADDVVQDTWMRALIATPSTERGLGGWLQRVAEGFVQKHRRSEGRRAEREQRYAAERRESLDTDQRSAVLRAVFEAVLALDEPYRETVLLRWFEGLPPRTIAERLGVRVATIDSRLQRAHARLRTVLERELGHERGGWRGVVAAVLGAPRDQVALPTFTLPLIGVVVGIKSIATAVCVVLGLCWWFGRDPAQADPVGAVAIASASAAPHAADPAMLQSVAGRGERELAASPDRADSSAVDEPSVAASATLPPGPFQFELRVLVVGADERPIPDAEVALGPESGSMAKMGRTDWDGVLARTWRAFEPEFRGVLSIHAKGETSSLRRITLHSAARRDVRFQLDGPPSVPLLTFTGSSSQGMLFVSEVAETPQAEDEFTLDAAGNGWFGDSRLAVASALTEDPNARAILTISREIQIVDAAMTAATRNIFDRIVADSVMVERPVNGAPRSEPKPQPGTVRGVVRDDRGQALTGILVVGRGVGGWSRGVIADERGEFVFESVPPGKFDLSVGGGELELVREVFELMSGETHDAELRPAARRILRARLVDAHSEPVSGWLVEARSAIDGAYLGSAPAAEHGSARIGLLGDDPLVLFARPLNKSSTPLIQVGTCASVKDEEIELQLTEEMRRGAITLTVDLRASDDVEVRAWRMDSREGVTLDKDAVRILSEPVDGKVTRTLLPGRWSIEVRTPGRAWTTLGEYHVAPGSVFDLGVVALPPLGELELHAREQRVDATNVSLHARIDGALVHWPEREIRLPASIRPRAGVPIDLRVRDVDSEGEPRSVFPEAKRLSAGAVESVELP